MKRLFLWWDQLTVPSLPNPAPPSVRERRRKARFVSRLVLVILLLGSVDLLLLLVLGQGASAGITVAALCMLVLALVCNRANRIALSGSVCVLCVILSTTFPVFASGTLDVPALLNLSFLGLAVMLAGALIQPAAAFAVALLSSSVIAGAFFVLPHTSALDPFFTDNVASVLFPAVILHLLLATITFFVIRDLLAAITRADRAEEIALLQEQITQHERAQAQDKQQLKEGIRQIATVHAQVATGHLEARVSLRTGNVLWDIAVPLNNLLSRMQRLKQERDLLEHEVQTMRDVLSDKQARPPRQPATPTT